MKKLWLLAALLSLPLSACNCGDEPGGGGDEDGAIGSDDGASGGDGSQNGDGSSDNDGGVNGDGSSNGDGGGTDGSPLEEPLSEFCQGMGTTVVVVGGGGKCAGEIAQNTFQFGLCACDTVSVQSTLDLDAFDSNLGAYGATSSTGPNISDDGNMGINGLLDMDGKLTARGSAYIGGGGFSVGASSRVTGLVYAAGPGVQVNASTIIERNAYFDGDVSGRFEIGGDLHVPATATVSAATLGNLGGALMRRTIPSVVPCPCEPSQILDVPALTAWAAAHNDNAVERVLTSTTYENGGPATLVLPCGRYYLTRIIQPAGLNIRAEGRTVLFVDGDMTIGGNFGLELAPGAEVDLFIAGNLSVGASARFGTQAAPSKVRSYVGGSGGIVLSASAVFGGMLYAPNANVTFSASADLYGALFCNSADFNGSASVHYDTAVRTAGQSCEETPDGSVADGGTADGAGLDGGMDDAGTVDGGSGDAGAGDGGPPDPGCVDDLDCTAPNVCVMGMCQPNF